MTAANQIITILCLTLLSAHAWAQVEDKSQRVALAVAVEQHGYALTLTPKEGSGTPLRYRPNTRTLFGYEFSYKHFAFAVMQKSPMSPEESTKYGTTEYFDFRAILSFGKEKNFFLAAYYNQYRGFYIENSDEVDPSRIDRSRLDRRPDLIASNVGGSLIYIWDPKQFSVAAAVFQTARQTKSGGSILLMASGDVNDFHSDQSPELPLVPQQLQSSYGVDALMTRGRFTTASASAGYGLTIVADQSYFLTGIGMFGSGYQWRKYGTESSQQTSTTSTQKFSYMVSAGFNGAIHFLGGGIVYDRNTFRTESMQFTTELTSLRIFAGIRM